jgi:hypothetical protein
MIEALVRHFEEHGFTVHVLPGVLHIRKVCKEDNYSHPMIIGWGWAIPERDLRERRLTGALFDHADQIIAKLDEAIAAHEASH